MENSLELSPEITNPAVLLDVHIQKKQSQDGKNASVRVCPSEQHSQDNEITQRVDRENVVYAKEDMPLCATL